MAELGPPEGGGVSIARALPYIDRFELRRKRGIRLGLIALLLGTPILLVSLIGLPLLIKYRDHFPAPASMKECPYTRRYIIGCYIEMATGYNSTFLFGVSLFAAGLIIGPSLIGRATLIGIRAAGKRPVDLAISSAGIQIRPNGGRRSGPVVEWRSISEIRLTSTFVMFTVKNAAPRRKLSNSSRPIFFHFEDYTSGEEDVRLALDALVPGRTGLWPPASTAPG